MTAPQRLIEAEDDFERDLIRSAHADQPSQRAFEQVLLGLGVGFSKLPSAVASSAARAATSGAALPPAAAASAVAPAATTGAVMPGAALSGKVAGVVLAKWVVAGLAVGVSAITGAQAIGGALAEPRARTADAPERAPASSTRSTAAVGHVASFAPPLGSLSTPEPSPSPSALAPSNPPRASARPVVEAGAPVARALAPVTGQPNSGVGSSALPAVGSFALETRAAAPSGLASEMRLLDAARRDLARGDSAAALATLSQYERAFPNGALGPEASVLKVRAALAAGDRAGAEALGERVIRQAPHSEHADAVRAALSARSNP